jgi:hypothetical protein
MLRTIFTLVLAGAASAFTPSAGLPGSVRRAPGWCSLLLCKSHKYSPLRIWAHSFVKFETLVDVLNLFLSPSKNARGCAVNTSIVGELSHTADAS